MEPLADELQGYRGFDVRKTLREEASKEKLSRLLGADAPALLFASCHGVNFWPDDPLQPSDQGALLCYDWPGPRIWGGQRIPPDFYLASQDVGADTDLQGSIVFFYSCYGIGTPRLDSFDRNSGQEIREIAERDILAALPQRLLEHPRGALAVVGHVDQAWFQSSMNKTAPTVPHLPGKARPRRESLTRSPSNLTDSMIPRMWRAEESTVPEWHQTIPTLEESRWR